MKAFGIAPITIPSGSDVYSSPISAKMTYLGRFAEDKNVASILQCAD